MFIAIESLKASRQ